MITAYFAVATLLYFAAVAAQVADSVWVSARAW
jgi:hypothetical protein